MSEMTWPPLVSCIWFFPEQWQQSVQPPGFHLMVWGLSDGMGRGLIEQRFVPCSVCSRCNLLHLHYQQKEDWGAPWARSDGWRVPGQRRRALAVRQAQPRLLPRMLNLPLRECLTPWSDLKQRPPAQNQETWQVDEVDAQVDRWIESLCH